MGLRFRQRLVVSTQRRTTVTTDKTCGIFSCGLVAKTLQHGQANQRVNTAHERSPCALGVFVVKTDGIGRSTQLRRVQRGVHGQKSPGFG